MTSRPSGCCRAAEVDRLRAELATAQAQGTRLEGLEMALECCIDYPDADIESELKECVKRIRAFIDAERVKESK